MPSEPAIPLHPTKTYTDQKVEDFAGPGSRSIPYRETSTATTGANSVRAAAGASGNLFTGTVNFLGSSYSGADIEILATIPAEMLELYVKESERNLEELNKNEEQLNEDIKNAVTSEKKLSLRIKLQELNSQRFATENLLMEQYKNADKKYVLIPLAAAHSLSVSVFREKYAVRSLGFVHSKGVSKGPRTVGGTIVFTVFEEHALAPFLAHPSSTWIHEQIGSLPLIDQLPPMTITVRFTNEYGSISEMAIYGVEFISDGQVLSVEDIFSENTCSYIARDYDIMLKRDSVNWERTHASKSLQFNDSGSSLLKKNKIDYMNYQQRLGLRRNPYI